jgi:hypothetical protein
METGGSVGGNRSKKKCAEQHGLEKGPQNGSGGGDVRRP